MKKEREKSFSTLATGCWEQGGGREPHLLCGQHLHPLLHPGVPWTSHRWARAWPGVNPIKLFLLRHWHKIRYNVCSYQSFSVKLNIYHVRYLSHLALQVGSSNWVHKTRIHSIQRWHHFGSKTSQSTFLLEKQLHPFWPQILSCDLVASGRLSNNITGDHYES